jgi:formate-dependent nitrite reductase cytochrome c552 subunit
VFPCNLPRCRSQRSEMKTTSKVTTVTLPIAMKSGCNRCAPMSEMYLREVVRQISECVEDLETYAMVCPPSMGVMMGAPS